MKAKFIFACISFILTLNLCQFEMAKEDQDFNDALENFIQTRKRPKFNTKKTLNRVAAPNMRRSSEKAFYLNQLFNFARTQVDNHNKQLAMVNKRQLNSNPISHPDPGYFINSTQCPFIKNITCDSTYIYRSFDGTCNNLQTPLLGSIDTPYIRLLPPNYNDGVQTLRQSVNGGPLPNPRHISLNLSVPIVVQKLGNGQNHLFVFFGQLITHDIGGTATVVDSTGTPKDCPCGSTDPDCIPITIPANDPYLGIECTNPNNLNTATGNITCQPGISNITCISLTRSASSPTFNCSTNYREVINLLSSYLDGSAIYGMNSKISQELRTFTNGNLLTSQGESGTSNVPGETITNRDFLPLSSDYCSTNWTNPTYNCFKGGEYRTSENLALVGMQTLFLREHNRIATQLASLNPSWSDETIYQETRRIVIAIYQHIIYNEWLPIIIGDNSLSPSNNSAYYNGYDSNINPQLTDEFATAAFRMGHSLVRQINSRINVYQNISLHGLPSYKLSEFFFQSDMAYEQKNEGLNSITVALLTDLAWKFGTYGNQIQNNLFQTTYPNGTTVAADLFAINLQRGRDHGLPTYVDFLKNYLNITINSFSDLAPSLMNGLNLAQLQAVYADVRDIDLYAGGLSETIVGNQLFAVGPTFGAIIMEQFKRLKNSDRFYYENGPNTSPYPFTLDQLSQIKSVTMAGLVCRNFDIFTIQKFAFWASNATNPVINCDSLNNQLNLAYWSNETTYDYYYYDVTFDNTANSTSNDTNNTVIDPNAFGTRLFYTGDNQTRPGLGINVGTITSGMSQWVFTNKFKHADCWRSVSSRDNWVTYAFAGSNPTEWDTNGYPVNFTYKGQWGGNLGYLTQLGVDGLYPTGDYYLSWNGTGNMSVFGDAQNPIYLTTNSLKFTVNTATTTGMIFVITMPNTTGIDLREAAELSSTNTFGTKYLQALQPFQVLRFAAWTVGREADYNPIGLDVTDTNWTTRRPTTFYTQSGRVSASFEYMVELGNVLQKDIWLSVPSTANQNFIKMLALYVRDNFLSSTSTIYLEQSSEKNFKGNNKTLEFQLMKIWKTVNDTRVKNVIGTSFRAFFNNPPQYSTSEYEHFDYYAVSGAIGASVPFASQSYDVSLTANYTTDDIIDIIRQQIYLDEIDLIYMIQNAATLVKRPLIAYDVGFRATACTYNNRWKNTSLASLEQRLEDLVIETLKLPIVKDLYLDFMRRWYELGGGLMVLSNLVDKVDRCTPSLTHHCGYHSTLANLLQDPLTVPKYNAAISWLNGSFGNLPFTSADVPVNATIPCQSCVWGTCYQGECVCFNGYTGSACDQLGVKYQDCASNTTKFGMVLNGIPDWSSEVTFVDIHRRSRQWIVQPGVMYSSWAAWNQSDINLDPITGYPLYLKPGQVVGTFQVRDVQAHFPNGAYVCLYDGDGVLDFTFDAKVTRRGPGRIELWTNWTTWLNNGMYYNIIRTNPSNPIRNIRIFESRFESTYQYFPYHPLFLDLMKKYSLLRFMPWSNTETVGPIDWSTRTTNSYYSFNQLTGVSIEMQVNLCNTLGVNPWFNIPYQATDTYITNWATYVRDNLRPDVDIYIEQGNECWGLGTQCGIYATKMGLLENITVIANQSYYSAEWQARICYHTKMGKHYADIIKGVFGPVQSKRIKFVLNTQAAWMGPIEIFFLCPNNTSSAYDLVALAPYLSDNMTYPNGSLLSLDEFYSTRINPAIKNALDVTQKIAKFVRNHRPTMEIGFYEAGPDFSSLTQTGNTYLTNLSFYIHRDPRMYSALRNYISNMTQTPGLLLNVYNHFASAGLCSKYGCWGIIESSDANLFLSPKYMAYQDAIDAAKVCSWNERTDTCPGNNTCMMESRGICSQKTALSAQDDRCYCYFGYELDEQGICQIKYIPSIKCTYQCGGKGNCTFDHYDGFYAVSTCHCIEGYYGYGCGLFDCSLNCSYNGLCMDYNNCSCYRGYTGQFCDVDCGCNGHGICASDQTCICDSGYTLVGAKCQPDCKSTSNGASMTSRPECLVCQASCEYGDCVLGVCQCWAGFTLDSRGTCTIKTTSSNDGSKLGINVNGVVDWSTQWTFVDVAIGGRGWIIQHIENLNDLYIWSLDESFSLRSDYYPAAVPYQRQLSTILLRDVQQRWPSGIYHVFYDGEGYLDFGFDAKILDATQKNYIKINVNLTIQLDNGIFIKMKKTNPLNPLRNIRVVMDGYQYKYQQVPFHPLFLERLKPFKTIRFMPWTAQDGIVNWSDRITTSMFNEGRGIAYEHMIHLCNILKTNCWLTVPYAASDDFVTQMATLVFNTLRKDVQIDLEYTNEAWNTAFNSGLYCTKMGLNLGLSSDPTTALNLYYSMRSQQIIKIWQNVFQNEQTRITLVLGTFANSYWGPIMSTRILSYQNAYKSHSNIFLAITGYISCGDPTASHVAIDSLTTIFAGCDSDLPNIQSLIQKLARVAANFSVGLGMYESGSGMVEYNAMMTGDETPGATAQYIAFHRDPRIANVYLNYYTMFDSFNLTENSHFAYVGLPTKYGPWFLLEYQAQDVSTAYRYKAMLQIINQTRSFVSPPTLFTCNNIAANLSNVCSGTGICVAQDTCQPFPAPKSQSDITISPTNGQALVEKFFIQTLSWTSMLPLQYAFGIVTTNATILTDYNSLPWTLTILPFISSTSPLKIVVFVKDSLGNVYTQTGSQTVTVTAYTGNTTSLQSIMQNFTQTEKYIAFYDKSPVSASYGSQLINNIDLTTNQTGGLANLETITSILANNNNNEQMLSSLTTKLTSFLSNSSVMLTQKQTQSLVNTISNMHSVSSNSSSQLLQSLASLLLSNGQFQINASVSAVLPSMQYTANNFNLTVSSFNLTNFQTSQYANYTSDVAMDLSAIFSGMAAGSTNAGISLIKYAADDTNITKSLQSNQNAILSNQLDLKFYANNTIKKVSGLTRPIKLKFVIHGTVDLTQVNSKLTILCKYLDTQKNNWTTDGCVLADFNVAKKVVTCNCNHTTTFTVMSQNSNGGLSRLVFDASLLLIALNTWNFFFNF